MSNAQVISNGCDFGVLNLSDKYIYIGHSKLNYTHSHPGINLRGSLPFVKNMASFGLSFAEGDAMIKKELQVSM